MTPISSILSQLDAAEKAATADLPWEHVHIYPGEEVIRCDLDRPDAHVLGRLRYYGDAEFFVLARTHIRQLLTHVAALEAERDDVKTLVVEWAEQCAEERAELTRLRASLALCAELESEIEKLFPFLADDMQRSTRGQAVKAALSAIREAREAGAQK